MAERVETAVTETGTEATVEKVTDINVLTGFGVLIPPAIVVDGEVKISGRVATVEEIKQLL